MVNRLLTKIKSKKLTADQYVILHYLSRDHKELAEYLRLVKPRYHQLQFLHRKGYILLKEETRGYNLDNIVISKYGKAIVNEKKENVEQWIDEYLKLFPTHVTPGGYRLSGNKDACITRMKNFIEDHPEFTKDIILQATKNYLERIAMQDYAYAKKNSKFIYDKDGSVLEQECIAVTSNDDEANLFIDKA